MLTRIALSFLMLLLAIPAAGAASFDCAKASTSFEQAICESPALSRQDEVLAKAYATALGGLSREAAAIVQKGQREWLAFAERACTDDAQPMQDAYDEDGVSCLGQLFTTRIGSLEESRMRSGRRIYQVDRYLVMPDPDATEDSWNKVAVKELTSPRIDGEDAEALAFNAWMDGSAAQLAVSAGAEGATDLAADATSDNQIRTIVEAITDRRITLSTNDWWYGHGAAHGNYTISYLHFLAEEGRELVASDIFAGDDWRGPLKELVLAELNRSIEGGIWPESVELLDEAVADPRRWNFSREGLVVQFQPYEVTAYAYGAPTVTIPWSALQQYTTAAAVEITTD
jgi:uncharacterized protein